MCSSHIAQIKSGNKKIKQQEMANNAPVGQSHSSVVYSSKHSGAEDIKKGLQRIKQAQIEVLRELRKDDPEMSKNCELTYSKETTWDSKPTFKFDADVALLKQRVEKLATDLEQANLREARLRKDLQTSSEESKKLKEANVLLDSRMKEYERSQESALAKAQEALQNAINSEKKFIGIKVQYEKLVKERQAQTSQIQRLQKKQLSEMLTQTNPSDLTHKLINELSKMSTTTQKLHKEISFHKCSNSVSSSTSSPSQYRTTVSEHQQSLSKCITRVISTLYGLMPSLVQVQQMNYKQGQQQDITQANRSFQEDIRKIEQQVESLDAPKGHRLKTHNSIKHHHSKHQEVAEYKQQVDTLKQRLSYLLKQIEQLKIDKLVLEEEYEKFKKRVNERDKLKDEQIDSFRTRLLELQAKQNNVLAKQDTGKISIEQQSMKKKLADLDAENKRLQTSILEKTGQQEEMKKLIQSQKSQITHLSQTNALTNSSQKFQIQKLTHQLVSQESVSKKSQEEWDQLIAAISKLQEEKLSYLEKEKITQEKMEDERNRANRKIQQLQADIEDMQKKVQDQRRFSVGITFERGELARLQRLEDQFREKEKLQEREREKEKEKEKERQKQKEGLLQVSHHAVQYPKRHQQQSQKHITSDIRLQMPQPQSQIVYRNKVTPTTIPPGYHNHSQPLAPPPNYVYNPYTNSFYVR